MNLPVKFGRYGFLAILASVMVLGIVIACGEEEPTATPVPPTATSVPATATAVPPTATPEPPPPSEAMGMVFDPGDVAREDTLTLFHGGSEGRFIDHELWNPYAIGANHQQGPNLIFEPLAFFSAFANEEIMWLAEDYSYNDDFTELTINCREGISWSDGEDFDCEDVVYTLNTLKELKEQVRWGKDVDAAMDNAELVDKYTAKVNLLRPDPRFFFLLTYKFDIGVYIVPEHHYNGRDWTTFGDYNRDNGWPLSTGPWQVTTVDRAEDLRPPRLVVGRRRCRLGRLWSSAACQADHLHPWRTAGATCAGIDQRPGGRCFDDDSVADR